MIKVREVSFVVALSFCLQVRIIAWCKHLSGIVKEEEDD